MKVGEIKLNVGWFQSLHLSLSWDLELCNKITVWLISCEMLPLLLYFLKSLGKV